MSDLWRNPGERCNFELDRWMGRTKANIAICEAELYGEGAGEGISPLEVGVMNNLR